MADWNNVRTYFKAVTVLGNTHFQALCATYVVKLNGWSIIQESGNVAQVNIVAITSVRLLVLLFSRFGIPRTWSKSSTMNIRLAF